MSWPRSRVRAGVVVAAALVALVACSTDELLVPAVAPSGSGVETLALPDGSDTTVTEVVDGDTIKVASGETVRLIGVDTPEVKHPSKPVGCFGQEASAYTSQLLPPGTGVRLSFDVEQFDRYGRTLAYVYRSNDALFVNDTLVNEGFAHVSTYPPNVAHALDFAASQRAARDANRGLWAACDSSEKEPESVPTVGPFANCSDAREAGAAPVHRGDPGYGTHLDGDGDGIGCT